MTEIYLDNAATTRPYAEVCQVVQRAMAEGFGNPASLHRRGVEAERQVAAARQHIRQLVGAGGWDVLFTSGGTEANNLAIRSSCPRGKRNVILTSSVEHASVIDTATMLAETRRCGLHVVGAGEHGVVNPGEFASLASAETALVTITHVANEMGTVQPVNEIARAVKRTAPRCRVHVDAVQAAAQLPRLDYGREVDSVTISGHKIHGPQGVGALLFRTNSSVKPLFCGGDQQRGMRPGTLNLPGIAGMGEAARLTLERRDSGSQSMHRHLEIFRQQVCTGTIRQLGDNHHRAPGMLILAIDNVKSEVLLHTLEKYDVLASAGSACHSTRTAPAQCLLDAGLRREDGVLRISLNYEITEVELATAATRIHTAIEEVRKGKAGQ